METPHYIGRRGDIHKHFVGRRGGIPNVDRKWEGVSFKTSFNVELFLIVVNRQSTYVLLTVTMCCFLVVTHTTPRHTLSIPP